MNGRKSSVRVTIMGEEYTIRSDSSPEHTRAVADHVDRAIREVMSTGNVGETRKAAILAALQITDDLLRARAEAEEIAEGMRQLSSELRRRLPPAKRASGETAAQR
jgi:cell division protein ZapA